jgi:transcriptional regulator with XRE-family HTH domain
VAGMGKPGDATAMAEFGRRLKEARNRAGMSQMALADKAGLDFTYVSSVERAKRNLTLTSILRLAHALGLEPGELLDGIRLGG